jgi:hypothetical protein
MSAAGGKPKSGKHARAGRAPETKAQALRRLMVEMPTALETALEAIDQATAEEQQLEFMLEDGSALEQRHFEALLYQLRSARAHLRLVAGDHLEELGGALGIEATTLDELEEQEAQAGGAE